MTLHNFQSNFVFLKEGNSALLLNINFPISFTLNILQEATDLLNLVLFLKNRCFFIEKRDKRELIALYSTTVGTIGLARQLTVSLSFCLVFLIFNRFATFHLRKTEISNFMSPWCGVLRHLT